MVDFSWDVIYMGCNGIIIMGCNGNLMVILIYLKKSGIFDGFMGYIEDLFGIKQSVIGIG
jgi:hypothetical protein